MFGRTIFVFMVLTICSFIIGFLLSLYEKWLEKLDLKSILLYLKKRSIFKIKETHIALESGTNAVSSAINNTYCIEENLIENLLKNKPLVIRGEGILPTRRNEYLIGTKKVRPYFNRRLDEKFKLRDEGYTYYLTSESKEEFINEYS